jgi:hypothetical protein
LASELTTPDQSRRSEHGIKRREIGVCAQHEDAIEFGILFGFDRECRTARALPVPRFVSALIMPR